MKSTQNVLTVDNKNYSKEVIPIPNELCDFIGQNEKAIIGIIFGYVKRANVWQSYEWHEVAKEIWSATKQTALEKAAELEITPQLNGWLLRTANNHILRLRSIYLENTTHEKPVEMEASGEVLSEIDVFDKLQELIDQQEVERLLSPLNAEERQMILFAKVYELNSKEIGKKLNITPEAARQRISRILGKLRKYWLEKGL
jgi:RNA polymerase sigma factor (sigma-70 family)